MIINNVKIYMLNEVIERGHVVIRDGLIEAVEQGLYDGDEEVFDGKRQHLLPGFIDIHIHGGYGQDAMDADCAGLGVLSEGLLTEGTTTFLATTMTEDIERIEAALKVAADCDAAGAAIAGIHMEGPFISEHKVGAQNPAYVARPSIDLMTRLQQAAQGNIRIVTIAPEVEGAHEVIGHFDDIIFSLGHTVASFAEMNAGAAAGARHVTHLYNAQSGFTHRAAGAVGAAWLNDSLNVEIICDGVHSAPAAVKIAYQMKGLERIMLITDAMRAKGMPDGEYELGGQKVFKHGKYAKLEDGTLAGSVLKMNEGLRNFMAFTGASLEDAWRTTSYNQAQALRFDDIGSIEAGKQADLVLVDDEINVLTTIKKGYMKMIGNQH